MKTFLSTMLSLFGVVGILLDAVEKLPEGFPLPSWAISLGTVLPLLFLAFSLQDEFEEGKSGVLELIQRFLADPYRALALTALAGIAKGLIDISDPASPIALGAQGFLAVLTAIGFIVSWAKTYTRREILKQARLNKLKVL